MRKELWIVAIALALAACGGGNNTGGGGAGGTGGSGGGIGGIPDYVSGTRIKARVQSTPDGAKAFAGFYDSMLATTCGFGRAADDALRCLPTNIAYAGSYWGDSGCTAPSEVAPSTFAAGSVDTAP